RTRCWRALGLLARHAPCLCSARWVKRGDADEAHLVQSAFTQRDWARSRDASFEQRARDFLIAHRVVVRAADLELVTGADGEQLVDRRIVVVAPLPVEIPTRDLHQARAATVTVLERDLFIDTDV